MASTIHVATSISLFSRLSNSSVCTFQKAAKEKGGVSDADLAVARDYQRKAQFYIDFIMSENSMGFHASEESLRILSDGINMCRLGQLALRGEHPVPTHLADEAKPAAKVVNVAQKQ